MVVHRTHSSHGALAINSNYNVALRKMNTIGVTCSRIFTDGAIITSKFYCNHRVQYLSSILKWEVISIILSST